MTLTQSSPMALTFKVHRREPELIAPAIMPTPRELKPLSDLDDRDSLRFHQRGLQFYRSMLAGVDPVKVIREGIAKTLVFYYPLAGRLREGPKRKLIVECTGEGILFIEADADVSLEQFGYPLAPPFPCSDQLLYDVPGSTDILNSPLVLIQVTRLKCGGFIFGIRMNHTMCDAVGTIQFMSAIGEMVRGAIAPSVLPTWERHVLSSITNPPPPVTYLHPEFNPLPDVANSKMFKNFVHHDSSSSHQGFFFSKAQLSALRSSLPLYLRKCSTFEILTACVWKCRTIALQSHPTEEMRLVFAVNLRSKLRHLIPPGYYGNAFVHALAASTAKELCERPVSFALELIRNAKENVTEELVRSLLDFLVSRDRPALALSARCYIVIDWTRAGLGGVDFGWGKAVYSGPPTHSQILGYHVAFKDKNGEDGIMLSLCLPTKAMKRFAKELNNMLQDASKPTLKMSAL